MLIWNATLLSRRAKWIPCLFAQQAMQQQPQHPNTRSKVTAMLLSSSVAGSFVAYGMSRVCRAGAEEPPALVSVPESPEVSPTHTQLPHAEEETQGQMTQRHKRVLCPLSGEARRRQVAGGDGN
jgi:hypothetical protein